MRAVLLVLAAVAVGMAGVPALADHGEVVITVIDDFDSTPPGQGGCEGEANSCFTPYRASVDVGGKVIFRNTAEVIMVFQSGTIDEATDDFVSGPVQPGESFEWTPEEAGEYMYFSQIQPWASGVITVVEAPEPVEPVEPEPVEPVEPADPVEPVEPVDPEPVEPVEPVEPTEPAEPMDTEPATTPPAQGGCLIATAAYGTEMAKEVQQLRELRDRVVMGTESGSSFMGWFNDIYYSFSPAIADLQREHPAFRELVRISIVPLVSSLSLMHHADIETDAEMLGYGISLIMLNAGMYAGIPAFGAILLVRSRRK
ncbi:Copper binding protein, plastocyanin/azurin family [Nitrosopumilaceae archaeon]|nr:hypothetical protein [Nitrosopumilus sp.]MDA7955429.1 hypothetical protein [Nitrosopumilus sp.]CAI9831198.1 Copper binding protein, plastocyanin/azurin family [Nitrosopumilaceae archaeon]